MGGDAVEHKSVKIVLKMNLRSMRKLTGFLSLDQDPRVRASAIVHIVGFSASDVGMGYLLKEDATLKNIVLLLTDEAHEETVKQALIALVNITAYEEGAPKVTHLQMPEVNNNFIRYCVDKALDLKNKFADYHCQMLANLSRPMELFDHFVDVVYPRLNDLLNVFVAYGCNPAKSELHYIAAMLSNLTRSEKVRKWLMTENPHLPFLKILPFTAYEESDMRRQGIVATIRNICLFPENHCWLLHNDIGLLQYILKPLMGPEDYPDDEMIKLPLEVQHLPPDKKREPLAVIRQMHLEILYQLCAKRVNREILRNNGVYYALREYHKFETDRSLLKICELVVNVLIRTEEEIGVEDIDTMQVPKELLDEFDAEHRDTVAP